MFPASKKTARMFFRGNSAACGRPTFLFLKAFYLLPLGDDFSRRADFFLSKNVGVAAHQFLMENVHHVPDGEKALLGGDFGVEEDLVENVSQLLAKIFKIVPTHGQGHLLGFFAEVFEKASVGLFPVPGTAFGAPQAGHDFNGVVECGAFSHGGRHFT